MYKYRYLALPIIAILICFFLSISRNDAHIAETRISAYSVISFIALLVFVSILVLFRFKKYFPIPSKKKITAPINGKVTNIEKIPQGYLLTIQKPFFASTEVVTCSKSDIPFGINTDIPQVSWEVSGMLTNVFIDDTIPLQAVLVGVAPGRATCDIFVPLNYKPTVFVKTRIKAGNSTIAKEIDDFWVEKKEKL